MCDGTNWGIKRAGTLNEICYNRAGESILKSSKFKIKVKFAACLRSATEPK